MREVPEWESECGVCCSDCFLFLSNICVLKNYVVFHTIHKSVSQREAIGTEENCSWNFRSTTCQKTVLAFNMLFFCTKCRLLVSYFTEMCIFRCCFVFFFNIYLTYSCVVVSWWYGRLDESLCSIFVLRAKEEIRNFELICGLHLKTLTIHQTLVTLFAFN